MLRESSFSKHWPIVPLSEAVVFLDNLRKPITASERVEGEYAYYGANGLQGTVNDYIFSEPLVLLAEDGGHFGNPDRDIAYIADGKYWVNNHAHVLKPRENVDLHFLYRVLQRYDVSPFIKGATRAKLTKGDASRIPFPIPPLKEQKRIAAILEKTDNLRRKRQQAIQLADEFLRAVFLDMFGDPVTNPKGWDVYRMGDVINFKGGSQPPKDTFSYEPREGYVRLVQIRDFKSDRYLTYIPEKLAKRQFGKDDVMIARYGPPVFQILRGLSGSYNVALMKAEPKGEILKDFIFHLLQIPAYHDRVVAISGRTAGQTGVNLDLLNSFDLPLPPVSVQREICDCLISMENTLNSMNAHCVEAGALFNSLSQKAFSGKL